MTMNRHDKYCLPLLSRVVVLLELGEREARREKMLASGGEGRRVGGLFLLSCSKSSNQGHCSTKRLTFS